MKRPFTFFHLEVLLTLVCVGTFEECAAELDLPEPEPTIWVHAAVLKALMDLPETLGLRKVVHAIYYQRLVKQAYG